MLRLSMIRKRTGYCVGQTFQTFFAPSWRPLLVQGPRLQMVAGPDHPPQYNGRHLHRVLSRRPCMLVFLGPVLSRQRRSDDNRLEFGFSFPAPFAMSSFPCLNSGRSRLHLLDTVVCLVSVAATAWVHMFSNPNLFSLRRAFLSRLVRTGLAFYTACARFYLPSFFLCL